MSYELIYLPGVAQQTIPLSAEDYDSLVAALIAAKKDPFDPAFSIGRSDVHVRRILFGVHVIGQASVFVDPEAQMLRVFDVRWTS